MSHFSSCTLAAVEPRHRALAEASHHALSAYRILGTPAEPCYDRITRLAIQQLRVPAAFISFFDADRQWFKSSQGLDALGVATRDISLTDSICLHAVAEREALIIEDATRDKRFAKNPFVAATPGIRFYAGIPLQLPEGVGVGTLCVIDTVPRRISTEEVSILKDLAAIVCRELELRRTQYALRQPDRLRALELERRADSAERMRAVLLTNLNHEVRTPLTGILGGAQFLLEDAEGESRRMLELIQEGGERLLNTMNTVMDLAQLEGKTWTPGYQPVRVCEEVRRATRQYRRMAEEKGIAFHSEGLDKELEGVTDRQALTRIVQGLVSNAVKFTQAGRVAVRLNDEHALGTAKAEGEAGHQSVEADRWLIIEVEDTGAGMHEAYLARMFEPFSQESEGMARRYEGVGIGLTVVKHYVEGLEGNIEVKSRKDIGTHVRVRLPFREARGQDGAVVRHASESASTPSCDRRALK